MRNLRLCIPILDSKHDPLNDALRDTAHDVPATIDATIRTAHDHQTRRGALRRSDVAGRLTSDGTAMEIALARAVGARDTRLWEPRQRSGVAGWKVMSLAPHHARIGVTGQRIAVVRA